MRLDREIIDPWRARHPVDDDLCIAVGARDQRIEAADGLSPGERDEIILQHSIDGVLMVAPSKIARSSLPPFVRRKSFGTGHVGRVALEALDRAWTQDEHAVGGLAAENLLPGVGEHIEFRPIDGLREDRRGGIDSVSPCRSAAIQSEFGIRTPDVVPLPVKTTSREKSTWRDPAIDRKRPL